LVNSLWLEDGKIREIRNGDVFAFVTEGITKYSQGPRGHWRGEGNLFIEMLEDFPYHAKRFFNLQREKEVPHLRPIYRWVKKRLGKL